MTKTAMSKPQLLRFIDQVSFAVVDISLYLDTHPKDEDAINYFNHYSGLRRRALKEYEENYGPLTIDTARPEQTWQWATQKWPWEGGNC